MNIKFYDIQDIIMYANSPKQSLSETGAVLGGKRKKYGKKTQYKKYKKMNLKKRTKTSKKNNNKKLKQKQLNSNLSFTTEVFFSKSTELEIISEFKKKIFIDLLIL